MTEGVESRIDCSRASLSCRARSALRRSVILNKKPRSSGGPSALGMRLEMSRTQTMLPSAAISRYSKSLLFGFSLRNVSRQTVCTQSRSAGCNRSIQKFGSCQASTGKPNNCAACGPTYVTRPAVRSISQGTTLAVSTSRRKRNSLSRRASSACLRAVMSMNEPDIRTGRPSRSQIAWPRAENQRTSPLLVCARYSSSNGSCSKRCLLSAA